MIAKYTGIFLAALLVLCSCPTHVLADVGRLVCYYDATSSLKEGKQAADERERRGKREEEREEQWEHTLFSSLISCPEITGVITISVLFFCLDFALLPPRPHCPIDS